MNRSRRGWTHALLLAAIVMLAGCTKPGDVGPMAYREDATQVTVPADGWVEYKLFVEEGASFEYEWHAGMILFFDFHGEPEGGSGMDFSSHKAGSAGADQGSLTAPFTGTHGWYWENRAQQPVTVELTTEGRYVVVGLLT